MTERKDGEVLDHEYGNCPVDCPGHSLKDGEAGGRIFLPEECSFCGETYTMFTHDCPAPGPRIVVECWTCHDNNIRWHRGSHPVQASGPGVQEWIERHRAAGHDVRPVAQKGE